MQEYKIKYLGQQQVPPIFSQDNVLSHQPYIQMLRSSLRRRRKTND
jgi:hypothetical protein